MRKKDSWDNSQIPVFIWIKDIDHKSVREEVETLLSGQNFENPGDKVKAYYENMRTISKQYYDKNNNAFINNNLYGDSVKIRYISKYAPLIVANLTQNEIKTKTNCSEIVEIDYRSGGGSYPRTMDQWEGLSETDNNIKIGLIERYFPDTTNRELSNINIVQHITNNDQRGTGKHATNVSAIIGGNKQGTTSNATIYAVRTVSYQTDIEEIENLIDKGVYLMNYSAGYQTTCGSYTTICRWLDHLIEKYDIVFVKSAGNTGDKVTEPGMSYNATVVGSVYNRVISSFSSYIEDSGPNKPDITAPGENITLTGYEEKIVNTDGTSYLKPIVTQGTSYSTPKVTGAYAEMLKAGVKDLPFKNLTLKAFAMACVTDIPTDFQAEQNSPWFSNKAGAGILNGQAMLDTFTEKQYENKEIGWEEFPYNKEIKFGNENDVRVCLTWNKVNSDSIEPYISDLNLAILDPNGNQVCSSTSTRNNSEIVQFKPTVTGIYTIRVEGNSMVNETEKIALVWMVMP